MREVCWMLLPRSPPFMKRNDKKRNTDVEIARIPLKGVYVLLLQVYLQKHPLLDKVYKPRPLIIYKLNPASSKVPNGVKYRVVVYDSEGGYVDQKVYTTGQNTSDDGQDFKLNGGSTYKFVVFHITMQRYHLLLQVQIPNHVIFQAIRILCTIQRNGYLRTNNKLSGCCDAAWKYTQVNVTLNTSEIGFATEVSGVGITPHHANNKIDLITGAITYDNTPVIKPFYVIKQLRS